MGKIVSGSRAAVGDDAGYLRSFDGHPAVYVTSADLRR